MKILRHFTVVSILTIFTLVFSIIACDDGNGKKNLTGTIINVLDYGAVSGKDSSDAIQAAINAAKAGDTVYIPNGNYIISKQIVLKSGITLKGESQDDAVLEVPYMSKIIGDGSLVYISPDSKNIEITKLTIFGNDGFSVENVIYIEEAENVNIRYVTIRNFDQNIQDKVIIGICAGYGPSDKYTRNIEVSNCVMDSIGPMWILGQGVQFTWRVSGIVVQDNVFTNVGRGGIFVNNYCTDIIIRRNIVTELNRISDMENDPFDAVLGIELWGNVSYAVVEDNVIDYWLSLNTSSYVAVRRNKIGTDTGFEYSALESAGLCNNNIFTDNTVTGGHKIGISIPSELNETTSYTFFGRNTVRDMLERGAFIASPGSNTNGYGNKYIYFKDCEILGTKQTENGDMGVFYFMGTSDYITLDGCKINDNEGLGVQTDAYDLNWTNHISFVNCEIKNNDAAFFYPEGHPLGAYFRHNNYTAYEFQNTTISGNKYSDETYEPRPFNNEKPVAIINGPATGSAGVPITFDSDSYDSDGSIGHILWDLDDGFPLNSAKVTHTYNKAGTYKVTLIVWDNEGRGSIAEKTVVIR